MNGISEYSSGARRDTWEETPSECLERARAGCDVKEAMKHHRDQDLGGLPFS